MPAFAAFAQNNFLIFMTSAMFARAMQDTGMAASIAHGISSKIGYKYAIPAIFFITGLLTYGGVSLFVVVFVVYPIALQMFKEANLSRVIIPGLIAAGAFTWAPFCLPGSPQAGPIVATQNLGTDLMVLPGVGIICAIFLIIMQLFYMRHLRITCEKKNLTFEGDEKTDELIAHLATLKLPNFWLSLVPMVVVLVTLNAIKLPVYYCMILGVICCLAFAWKNVPNKLKMLNAGAQSAIFALINTCAANGFGGVAKLTPGFTQLVDVFTNPNLMSPLVGLGIATTLIAGACGSGTGGITVALTTMAPVYLNMGVNAGMMHKVATLACCGLDSLPHNGAVVTLLNYCGISHKDGYLHIGVMTVLMPLITLAFLIIIMSLGIVF
ncbi:MAG: GntP family permease [Bacteroidales bacterium]|nr:GntP family permease [Bacteroidales bacterium]